MRASTIRRLSGRQLVARLVVAHGSDAELARKMRTNRQTVRRWRTGERPLQGPARVLCEILAEQQKETP